MIVRVFSQAAIDVQIATIRPIVNNTLPSNFYTPQCYIKLLLYLDSATKKPPNMGTKYNLTNYLNHPFAFEWVIASILFFTSSFSNMVEI